MAARKKWGIIEQLPSGRFRARYPRPDGLGRLAAPGTFDTSGEADAWLTKVRASILNGTWESPEAAEARKIAEAEQAAREAAARVAREVTLAAYGKRWIETRTNRHGRLLKPRTRVEYQRQLDNFHTDLTDTLIGDITSDQVRDWYSAQMKTGTVTQTSRAYDLLKSVLKTAVEDKLISENPCRIPGGGAASTGIEVLPPTDEEYEKVMVELSPTYRALAVIAAASGLRWGEITELRVRDITIERNEDGELGAVRINVKRAVVYTPETGRLVTDTKSWAGKRNLAVFGLEAALVAAHVESLEGKDTLLFSAVTDKTEHLPQSTFHGHWDKARKAAGRDDLKLHALRHYAGTRYAQTGATLKEIMARLGHSSTVAAMRYQHSGSRDDELAARMAKRPAVADAAEGTDPGVDESTGAAS